MDQFEFQNQKVVLKKLVYENVEELFEWAKDEGWNPGINDAFVAFNAFPNDFIGYFIDDEMIAAGSIVNYGGEFGFMGLFIVKKEYRFNGLGNLLWHQRKSLLYSKLNQGASIGMDFKNYLLMNVILLLVSDFIFQNMWKGTMISTLINYIGMIHYHLGLIVKRF